LPFFSSFLCFFVDDLFLDVLDFGITVSPDNLPQNTMTVAARTFVAHVDEMGVQVGAVGVDDQLVKLALLDDDLCQLMVLFGRTRRDVGSFALDVLACTHTTYGCVV
jgi:hypothetical protein